jgi:hypothetical protein
LLNIASRSFATTGRRTLTRREMLTNGAGNIVERIVIEQVEE